MSNLASKVDPDTLEAARATMAAVWEEHERSQAERRAERLAAGLPWREPEPDRADAVFSDCCGGVYEQVPVDDLSGFARAIGCSDAVRRSGPTEDSLLLWSYSHHGGPPFDDGAGGGTGGWQFNPDEPHHWVLLEDTDRTRGRVPRKLADRAALVAFAHQWRESHRNLRGRALAVFVVPGKQVVFAVWSPKKLTEAEGRAIGWELSGEAIEPRFRAVTFPHKFPALPESWEHTGQDEAGIYLPAVAVEASKALPRASSVARAAGDSPKLLTGIGALDSLAHGAPGIARGALVVAAGLEGSGKSSLFFEVAETDLAAGSVVLWVAHDESDRRIRQRQLKRRGLSAAEAERLPAAELAKLEPLDFFVIGAGEPLEISWQAAYECADGRPLTVVVDSLQKVNMAGLDDHGQRERIDAALRAIQACQVRWPATVLATSEATSSGRAKGSTGIGHAADMVLELSRARAADVVRVVVSKNRDGAEGMIEVVLDRVGQRVLDPKGAAQAKASGELRGAILDTLATHGPVLSGRGFEKWLDVSPVAVRAELRAMAVDGALIQVPKGFQLP